MKKFGASLGDVVRDRADGKLYRVAALAGQCVPVGGVGDSACADRGEVVVVADDWLDVSAYGTWVRPVNELLSV